MPHPERAAAWSALFLFMEVAPVMLTSLDEVRGLPPGFVHGMRYHGFDTVLALVDWADEPDQYGRVGKSKLRSLPNIGPRKANQIEAAMEAVGVDIDRPIPARPWI